MINQLNKIIQMIKAIQEKLYRLYRQSIYQEALRHLGTDASPDDQADDVLGCAESVTAIIGKVMSFPIILGTWTLWDRLRRDPRWKKTGVPMPGDIIISPTESKKKRGHVGIVGARGLILSNDSATGKFMANYTIDTWHEKYSGLRIEFFTRVR